jgi:hypothetical protein
MDGCAGRSTGTSPGPQIADDFFALRKSAEVGQKQTLAWAAYEREWWEAYDRLANGTGRRRG